MSLGPVLLAAGGTGGHLFPAEALAHVLSRRGVPVELVTDERALRYGDSFPARAMHTIHSATPRGGSPLARASAVARLGLGVVQSLALVRRLQPRAVIGFGGYPTVPPLVAAWLLRTPTVLHEANGVMGKANRFLAGRVDAIAAGFPLGGVPESWRGKIVVTGNPLRPNAIAAMSEPYPEANGCLRLLVTGGSQGARVMSDIVPAAVAALPEELRARLVIVQQTRQEDIARVSGVYERAGVAPEIAPFFSDLPHRIAQAQLVIARSGASTVSELAAIGRASILVPLPHALDQDQANNAAVLQSVGGAEVVRQENFTPRYLTERLMQFLADPEALRRGGENARKAGVADAAERLADLVEKTAGARLVLAESKPAV
ncbi:UDP-N-acetylglucosamine--N-acetylmuramyl-(pentapeptide) pyrophosphoryl-undecaprenol N-acetylglucosamine transferase [Methylocystis heyeri]|uniref:UDP-N-acetylglucosamine--N-acetylmuramyl-(pentapeptide) pyrophosphoryl-undecaprenol N-acetylglucosamine transferase n=1 Tax=Methylocystis heyeri TaxID=391905 RepID=A0A6B8KFF7_9HYPH|nr:UDP-N-acetylglucosamine--N-acetylmuramyl-(pentapeptide) pyrophosphoryl-undecaprenol N-acetylglucosamine transferase [Methylocystis heyeri]QGM45695.1 UDP-N-acetylglucosamine--N-acetylmuramyl-(pentapeptide) pyrophosphoryl-undecaprenol N-acetylglucosamine transferase [Methylocystis heyeri]